MPDTRRHRGPHPEDAELFSDDAVQVMRQATVDYCHLLDRGYAPLSSLKLVGDRYQLRERQRTAINRSTCPSSAVEHRTRRKTPLGKVESVTIDGFNLLTTVEAALSGGVILLGREGCCRDMASMHGSYRRVEETRPALQLIGATMAQHSIQRANWLLDEPVSNSGRLAKIIRELAEECGWQWQVELVRDPDRDLVEMKDAVVVSADREVIDGCNRWCNLAASIVENHADSWVIALTNPPSATTPH